MQTREKNYQFLRTDHGASMGTVGMRRRAERYETLTLFGLEESAVNSHATYKLGDRKCSGGFGTCDRIICFDNFSAAQERIKPPLFQI